LIKSVKCAKGKAPTGHRKRKFWKGEKAHHNDHKRRKRGGKSGQKRGVPGVDKEKG